MALWAIESKMQKLISKYGSTTGLLFLSQVVSAVSLMVLPSLSLGISDSYVTSILLATSVHNGPVLGVIYLIAVGRPNFNGWRYARILVLSFSIISIAFSIFTLPGGNSFNDEKVLDISLRIIFGLGGLLLGLAGTIATKHACLGRPKLLVAITIAPNLLLIFSTLGASSIHDDHWWRYLVPAAAWTVGAAIIYFSYLNLTLPKDEIPADLIVSETSRDFRVHVTALLLGLFPAFLVPLGMLSAATQLTDGLATILFLVMRIASAIIGLLVNSLLLTNSSWKKFFSASRGIILFASLSSLFLILAALAFSPSGAFSAMIPSYFLLFCSWILLSLVSPLLLRELNQARQGKRLLAKTILDIIASALFLKTFILAPSASGYIGVLVASQAVTIFVCISGMHSIKVRISSLLIFSVAAICVLYGW